MRLEVLESRFTPAAVFTYTDTDGDLVTVTTSKGTKADLSAILHFGPAGPSIHPQLQAIDFSANAAVFAGTDLTVTARRTDAGGDGLANVGYIDASNSNGGSDLNLGLIRIRGDLGRIDAGSPLTAGPVAVRGLTVQSIGQFGLATQEAGGNLVSNLSGALGSLKVAGDICGAFINGIGFDAARIGSVTIGGSLLGGPGSFSGLINCTGPIGPVVIGGSIVGDGPASGRVGSSVLVASVTIGGSLVGGTGAQSGVLFSGGNLGPVRIGGDLRGDTGAEAGKIMVAGDLAKLTIVGSLIGGLGSYSTFDQDLHGQVAVVGNLGPVRIGHDLLGGQGDDSGEIKVGGRLSGLTIGGSLRGGAGGFSGTISGDIGRVAIGGDLAAGDGVGSGSIVAAGSMAGVTIGGSIVGAPSPFSGVITAEHRIGPIRIEGDIRGGSASSAAVGVSSGLLAAERIDSLFVGGSIIAGTASGGGPVVDSGSVHVDEIGPIVVKGSLVGNSGKHVVITASLSIQSLTVGGRVEMSDILAGYDWFGAPEAINADAQIGPVVVGDWIASSLVAGASPGGNDHFGDDDDRILSGLSVNDDPDIVSRITSIVIRGTAMGTTGVSADHFGFVAQRIGSFRIGNTVLPLTPGAGNDFNGLAVGITGDLRIREVLPD